MHSHPQPPSSGAAHAAGVAQSSPVPVAAPAPAAPVPLNPTPAQVFAAMKHQRVQRLCIYIGNDGAGGFSVWDEGGGHCALATPLWSEVLVHLGIAPSAMGNFQSEIQSPS